MRELDHKNDYLFDIDIPLDVAIRFCEDEGILKNYREKETQFSIDSPFISDNKRRCTIALINKNGSSFLVFNDFKARGNIDDELYKGSFFKFVKLIKDFSSVEEAGFYIITKYLREYNFERKPKAAAIKEKKKNEVSLKAFTPLSIAIHGEYYKYLKDRGVDSKLISNYKVFIDNTEKRIIFPVYEDGVCIFYIGRSIHKWMPQGLRWKKSEVPENAYPLWNLENVKDECWLFEGIFDGIFWPDKAVAYFGATITKELIEKIKNKKFRRIVFFGQNPFIDKASRLNRIKILDRFKEEKIEIHLFNWKNIKEKDLNEAIVNNSINDTDIEKRILPWDDETKLLKEFELV